MDDLVKRGIDESVQRFLGWRLPANFSPDAHISFTPSPMMKPDGYWPTGTNLLGDPQAREMLKYVVGPVLETQAAEIKRLRSRDWIGELLRWEGKHLFLNSFHVGTVRLAFDGQWSGFAPNYLIGSYATEASARAAVERAVSEGLMDLIERLRRPSLTNEQMFSERKEAADAIETLGAALQIIERHSTDEPATVARKALAKLSAQ